MEYSNKYLHIGEEIDPDDYVICKYKISTDLGMDKAAAAIAAEQSTGTWTGISTLNEKIFELYSGRVTAIEGDIATIAYPKEDFSLDIGGIPQVLSVISGNLFGLDALKGVRLEDVTFPKSMLNDFLGPRFGSEGLREVLKRPAKPLVGTIVKPKIGLSPKETANYIYEAGMGGLTNGKDDETLSNQKFCPMEDRVVAVAEAIDRVKEETGHIMIHAINVSTDGHKIVEVAEKVQELGASEIMVDVITCGFAAVQALREDLSIKLPIHVHRTMHGAITKNKDLGVSMNVFAKLVRMCGGDALHIGTFGVGKMTGSATEDFANQRACIGDDVPYKTMLPVCSGGMHPGLVEKLVEIAGTNIQIQAGGGVAGHPGGVRKGAMALVQAVDAAYEKIPAETYRKTHTELDEALTKWGSA
ncbi:RuBisCO large subunit C-terminal-like domain-containing protein [Candidatus Methanomassiliicoccus intestinalis]|uniref:RuBisCO large subunit C-terminal-like domain-containing protein n=1 Tax=Candidatus Methanomassiliicoccus intestinalis TaxID=1406512 RepID=UPI0037DC41CA